MRNRKGVLLVLCLLTTIIAGCAPDAPHDNPLDPASPNRKTDGNLSGKILTLGLPYAGISGALVTIEGTTSTELTATDGSFSFSNAPSGNVSIIVSKSLYLSDTLRLTLPVGGSLDTLIHIDALPQISNAQVVTSKIDQWYAGPVYTAAISADVADPDGFLDVDTVYVKIDSLTFGMSHTAGSNYQVSINADSLPNQDLQWLIGKQLDVFAIDHENGAGQSSGFYVTRIIESEPSPTHPTFDTTLTTHFPTFDWNPAVVSFDYTYQLQVVSLAGGTQTLVWSQGGFSSSITDFNFPDSLAGGDYYWTVALVDQFGNSSRSKEASFIVPLQ